MSPCAVRLARPTTPCFTLWQKPERTCWSAKQAHLVTDMPGDKPIADWNMAKQNPLAEG